MFASIEGSAERPNAHPPTTSKACSASRQTRH